MSSVKHLVFILLCIASTLVMANTDSESGSQKIKRSAGESAAETAWKSVLLAEDEKRFAKQIEAAASMALDSEAIRSSKSARAKEMLFQTQAIRRNAELGVREHYGVEHTEPETVLEEMLKPGTTYIFASQGMPEQILVSLLGAYEDNENHSIEIVFRGLNKDQHTISAMLRSIGNFIREHNLKPSVNIGLNPTIFNHFGVSAVPTIIHVLPNGRAASMQGILNLDYFFATLKSKEGKQGWEDDVVNLGTHGSMYDISERDLIEIIHERLAKIDWEEKKKNAQANYWKNYDYQKLPTALVPTTFYADMRVQVTEDIVVEGHVVARAGDILDPRDQLGHLAQTYNRRVIIINPNNTLQLKWAREQVKEALALNEKPLVMLSELNRGFGVATLFKVEEMMQVQIFLLVPEVVERFGVQALPASVVLSKQYPHAMLVKQWLCLSEKEGCKAAPKPTWEDA